MQSSPEPKNKGVPRPTEDINVQPTAISPLSSTPVSSSLASTIYQGPKTDLTTLTTAAVIAGEIEAPKSTDSLSPTKYGEAPYTPLVVSEANRQLIAWSWVAVTVGLISFV